MYLNFAIIPPGKKPIADKDVLNVCLKPSEVYGKYAQNMHHWTTSFIWNAFIPNMMKELEIDFNPDDFVLIPHTDESKQFDLSYHIPKDDVVINYVNITNSDTRRCKISELRGKPTENIKAPPPVTSYHKLYIGCHQTTEIFNSHSRTSRWLILNTDSMSIPLVPILAVYYQRILVLDNRSKKPVHSKMREYFKHEDTDLVHLFVEFNQHKNKAKQHLV